MGVGLNNSEGGEARKIEAFGNHLSADNDVIIAAINFVVDFVEFKIVVGIHVKAGNFGLGEEAMKLALDEFSADTFVVDAGVFALRTGSRDGKIAATGMATHLECVGMEDEWQKTVGAEGLPTTFVADSHRGSAAAVVKEHGLGIALE